MTAPRLTRVALATAHALLLLLLVSLPTSPVEAAATCSRRAPPRDWGGAYDATRGPLDWSAASATAFSLACSGWAHDTCCQPKHADAVWRSMALAERGGASATCLAWTERARCAWLCDPGAGTGATPPHLCAPACAAWFAACRDDFFAPPGTSVGWLPCHDAALVCSKARDAFASAADFCEAMGVRSSDAEPCLSGTPPPAASRGERAAPQTDRTSAPATAAPSVLEVVLDALAATLGSALARLKLPRLPSPERVGAEFDALALRLGVPVPAARLALQVAVGLGLSLAVASLVLSRMAERARRDIELDASFQRSVRAAAVDARQAPPAAGAQRGAGAGAQRGTGAGAQRATGAKVTHDDDFSDESD